MYMKKTSLGEHVFKNTSNVKESINDKSLVRRKVLNDNTSIKTDWYKTYKEMPFTVCSQVCIDVLHVYFTYKNIIRFKVRKIKNKHCDASINFKLFVIQYILISDKVDIRARKIITKSNITS